MMHRCVDKQHHVNIPSSVTVDRRHGRDGLPRPAQAANPTVCSIPIVGPTASLTVTSPGTRHDLDV